MSKIGASKPKKTSLISNLLNRVDDKSLAVKKSINDGILIYWELNTTKHLKCNKEVLALVSYEQIEQIMEYNELFVPISIVNFKLIENVPVVVQAIKKPVQQKTKGKYVPSIKTTDKIGTSKGEKEVFKKKPGNKKAPIKK